MAPQAANPVAVFYSYSHKDENLRNKLEEHLSILKRLNVIEEWHDRKIIPGKEWDGEIDERLNKAWVILLLISPSFMASDYCYDREVSRALERHKVGDALVIPVFLRPVMWEGAAFGGLQGLPTGARPVTSWPNRDKAFLDIAKGIKKAVESLASSVRPSVKTSAIAKPTALPSIILRPLLVDFVARRNAEGRDIVGLLKDELAPKENRVVVLWGAGGVGKTTLAILAARELSHSFRQRVVWVSPELHSDLTLSAMLDEIATQLGRDDLRQFAPEPKEKAVRALIAAAPTLVILDNFETIALSEQQPCANWLVLRASCSAIITTRERVIGARNISIDAMSPEESQEFLDHLIRQLPNSQVFGASERDHIIQATGANPLVMQWTVAQIGLAHSLSDVLNDLAKGKGDAAQRVFDRSFDLPQLGDDGRAALLALSLYAPSASRHALAEVAGFANSESLNEAVERLAALRLVDTTDGGERLIIQGLTRELARVRLMKDKRTGVFRRRFLAYFLSYVKAHAQPTPEDFDALEAEKDNVLNAVDVAIDLKDWESVQIISSILADPVDGVLFVRGYWDEAIKRNEQARDAAREKNWEDAIAVYSHRAGIIRQNRGEYDAARIANEDALAIYKKLGDKTNEAVALYQLGRLAREQGRSADAHRLYSESLKINKKLGEEIGIANALHQLGWLARDQGRRAEARRVCNESLEIYKKLGDQAGISNALHLLGWLNRDEGRPAKALQLYNESLKINKKLGDQWNIAITLHALGALASSQGKLKEAQRRYNESLAIMKKLGDQGRIAITYYNLGLLEERKKNRRKAAHLFSEALSTFKKLKLPYVERALRELKRVEDDLPEVSVDARMRSRSVGQAKTVG